MRTIGYSAAKDDLFTPWKRSNYFSNGEARHTASLCAELSRLAYCRKAPSTPPTFAFDRDKIQGVLKGIGFGQCAFFESSNPTMKGTHCFTAIGTDPDSGKQTGVVAFRGTDADDPTDIGDDADILLTKWEPGGEVHAGFLKALDDVQPGLTAAVTSMSVPLLFTGHSLGAALATLTASLYKSTGKVAGLVTFGSPRVGNTEFVSTLGGVQVRRYRDCADVVTRVPLPEMGYAHVGPPYYIDRNGLIEVDPPNAVIEEDVIAADCDYLLKYAWKKGDVGVRDLADHAPINYVWAVAQTPAAG